MTHLMPKKRVFGDTRRVHHYYQFSPDGLRVLMGGRLAGRADTTHPQDFSHHSPCPSGLQPVTADGCAETVLIYDDSGSIRKLCVELIPDFKGVFLGILSSPSPSHGRGHWFNPSRAHHIFPLFTGISTVSNAGSICDSIVNVARMWPKLLQLVFCVVNICLLAVHAEAVCKPS